MNKPRDWFWLGKIKVVRCKNLIMYRECGALARYKKKGKVNYCERCLRRLNRL